MGSSVRSFYYQFAQCLVGAPSNHAMLMQSSWSYKTHVKTCFSQNSKPEIPSQNKIYHSLPVQNKIITPNKSNNKHIILFGLASCWEHFFNNHTGLCCKIVLFLYFSDSSTAHSVGLFVSLSLSICEHLAHSGQPSSTWFSHSSAPSAFSSITLAQFLSLPQSHSPLYHLILFFSAVLFCQETLSTKEGHFCCIKVYCIFCFWYLGGPTADTMQCLP